MKGLSKNIVMLAALAVLVYLLFNMKSTTSTYASSPQTVKWSAVVRARPR